MELEEHSSIIGGNGGYSEIETNLPQNSAIPLLDPYPKGSSSYHKDTGSGILMATLFIIATTRKQN